MSQINLYKILLKFIRAFDFMRQIGYNEYGLEL